MDSWPVVYNDTLDGNQSGWINVTLVDSSVQRPTPPRGIQTLGVAVAVSVGLYALSLTTLVGNAMVIHAIRTERRLQTVSNMFIMSLAVADLTVGLIVMPVASAYAISGDWRLGSSVCQFWLSVDYTASTASILNLLVLSVDRYWSIRSPLKYLRKRTKRRALCMIALAWLASVSWVLPITCWRHWQSGPPPPTHICETAFADNVLFKLSASTANFYLPMILMIGLYVNIYREIKQRSRLEIGQCPGGGNGALHEVSEEAPVPVQLELVTRERQGKIRGLPESELPALRMRVTRKTNVASNLRRQKKAARQLGVIMGAFVLCWLPYIVTFIVTAYCSHCVSERVHTATIWLGYLNSAINPFLYALCNANFKRAFKKMFCTSSANHIPASGGKTDQMFA